MPKQQDDMAALSAQETKKAAAIAQYVEQIPAAAVTEMLERVLNYTGDEQRKVSQSVGRSVGPRRGRRHCVKQKWYCTSPLLSH